LKSFNLHNVQTIQEVAKAYKNKYGKDLIDDIKSETRGNLENLLVALMMPILDFYCKEINDAIDGIGTDEQVLIEILCTLSNSEIHIIKQRYNQLYGEDLEPAISDDTSGNFKQLIVLLCRATRDESGKTDLAKAKEEAAALLRAGELMLGTDESVFNTIMCRRNYEQLKLIFKEYEILTGHSFERAIKKEFSGDVKDGFLAIFRCVNYKSEFFAHQLMKSMKGLGEFLLKMCESILIFIMNFRHKRSAADSIGRNSMRN
jgi:annexin A7/11